MTPLRQALERACALTELRAKVQKHREAYSLEFFPNSEKLDDNSSRDSIAARMGRHMCDCFERYIDETEAESTSNAIADIAKIGDELQDVRVENARLREQIEALKALCVETRTLREENERLKKQHDTLVENIHEHKGLVPVVQRDNLRRALKELVSQHMRDHNGESKVYGHLIAEAKKALGI